VINIEEFKKLNEEIMATEKQQLEDEALKTTLTFMIKNIENEVLGRICLEKDPETQKVLYSNEMSRKTELAMRLNNHKEYNEASMHLENVDRNKDLRQIELEGKNRMFAAMKSINYAGREL
jgi:hypothetical protein